MVDWALENVSPTTNPSVLEIGCGNGTLVLAFSEAGYATTHLSGIDYSPGAIKLAMSIAATRGEGITFNSCDFLKEDPPILSHMKEGVWDLLLDKGTFDAIALGEKDEKGQSPAVNYPGRIQKLLAPGGCFLITCTCMPKVCVLQCYEQFPRTSMQFYRDRIEGSVRNDRDRSSVSVSSCCRLLEEPALTPPKLPNTTPHIQLWW
jgi:SAM-dependent methyltransferase